LDEFLDYFVKQTVTDESSQLDQLKYHNAALNNIGKLSRDGSDHDHRKDKK